ncbi:MAG: polyprenyl synthetase family protein [Bacillota bacterium]
MTFFEKQKHYIGLVEPALQSYLQTGGIPDLLRRSMSYSVFAGGKRLRPCMTLAAAELNGGSVEDALPFACALELIHTYSLIHDDLPAMDNDDFRRGRPTNHKVFGEGQAILAGDGLLSLAFEIMLETAAREEKPGFVCAALAIAKGAGVRGMVAGQCRDLQQEGKRDPDEALLHEIHRGKTAAMLIASVEAGAHCANADKWGIEALRQFGGQYGLLFQITDDILDVTGNAKDLGKSTGKDEREGKLTFPFVYGLNGAKERAEQAAMAAAAALRPFGDKAWYFHELIEYTLARRY